VHSGVVLGVQGAGGAYLAVLSQGSRSGKEGPGWGGVDSSSHGEER